MAPAVPKDAAHAAKKRCSVIGLYGMGDGVGLQADEGMISADMEMRAQKIALIEEQSHESMEHSALVEHEKLTKLKNVNSIELGKHRVECWCAI